MRSNIFRFGGVLIAMLGLTPFAAGKEKPALAIASKAIEARITIDETLRAYPGLYANLLGEGKHLIAKWRIEATAERQKDAANYRNARPFEYSRVYTRRAAAGRYVSIMRNDTLDALGAHGNRVIDTILWDISAKKRVSIRPLFKEAADNGPTLSRLAKTVRATLGVEKKKRGLPVVDPDKDIGLSGVEPNFKNIGAIALAPSTEPGKSAGLLFCFSPYAVGGYVEGSYTAFVPWRDFANDLSPIGAATFGGERPTGDDKND